MPRWRMWVAVRCSQSSAMAAVARPSRQRSKRTVRTPLRGLMPPLPVNLTGQGACRGWRAHTRLDADGAGQCVPRGCQC